MVPNTTRLERNVKILLMSTLVMSLASGTAMAGDTQDSSHHEHETAVTSAQSVAASPATDGVIRKVDHAAGTITVQHGPIESLGMAAMTMPYNVKDPAMLTSARPGDKIRMTVENIGGTFTIVALQRVP